MSALFFLHCGGRRLFADRAVDVTTSGLCRPVTGKRELADSPDIATNRTLQMLSNIKRRKSQRALAVLTKGPGGGAMEGPPLIHRDHHSVHAGMEYFK